MAAQNIIDVSWDLEKFDLQTQSVLKNMEAVFTSAKQGLGEKIPLGSSGGFMELKKNMQGFNVVQENTLRLTKLQEQAEQARLKTQKLTQDAIAAEAKARKANADAALQEQKAKEKASGGTITVDGGSRFTTQSQEATAEQTAAFEKLRQAEAEASMAAAEYGNSVNASLGGVKQATAADEELEKAKAAVAKANSQQNVELQGLNAQRQLANKAAKEEALNALGLLSPYQQLNKQYMAAQANAKDLAVQYGVESVEAKEAAATALKLNTQLQTIDKTVGLSQRNVGNYSGAFNRALGRATSLSAIAARSVQLLSRQIIQLGTGMLSFVIGVKALEAIGTYSSKMYDQWAYSAGNAERKQLELQNRIDELNKTVEDSAKAFEDATSNLAKLTIDVDLAKQGYLDENEVLKEYNDTMGKTTGHLKNFDELEAKLVADGPAYIKLLFLKAEATASFAQASIAAMKAITAQADAEKDFGNIDVIATNKKSFFKEALGIGSFGENLADVGIKSAKQIQKNAAFLKKQAEDSFKSLTKQGQDFEKQAAILAKKMHFNFFDDPKTKKGSVTLDSTKEALDLEFELYKIAQQRKLKLLDEEQNNTKNTFGERMLFAQEYYNGSVELANRTAQHEIDADKLKLKELEANYKKAKGTEKNNLAIDIENEKKQIIIATAKNNDELLTLTTAFNKKQDDIAQDENENQKRIFEEAKESVIRVNKEQHGAIDAIRYTEKASHDKLLHDKTISQKKYDEKEKKSINDNLILSLQADLQKEESLRTLAVLQHQSTVDIDNAITEIKAKITSAQTEPKKDKKKNKDLDYIKESVQSGQDLATGLVDIKYQKEMDAIQKIIDLNNYRKDQEMKNIEDSTLSNQEKAAQMIILDKTVAANNKKLEMEKAQIAIKQAKFDRDAAVISILENAAIAAFKMIGAHPLIGLAEGIAIEVAAAAQIAMILARPLPQMPAYATGTENHPGGPAIVGEGRFKELVSSPNGSFIADRPMLLNNLPQGSKVIPLTSDIINEAMYHSMIAGTAQRIQQAESKLKVNSNRDIIEAIEMGSRMTVQAMKKQKAANVVVNVNGSWGAYITKSVLS